MKFWKLASAATLLVASTSANSALIERLGGLAYYDDVADLTWLADANAAGTTMNWADANAWVANLSVTGVTGWRLADADTCVGFNCASSEIGNLYYNLLGGVSGGGSDASITNTHNTNYDLFSNVQANWYWTGTENPLNTYSASAFTMYGGYLDDIAHKASSKHAWAVQSGDVGVSAVPVPAAAWLFGSGLVGLIGVASRKKA